MVGGSILIVLMRRKAAGTLVAPAGFVAAQMAQPNAGHNGKLPIGKMEKERRAMLKRFSSLYPSDIAAWILAISMFGAMALAGLLIGLKKPKDLDSGPQSA
jgi:hypothetical protein